MHISFEHSPSNHKMPAFSIVTVCEQIACNNSKNSDSSRPLQRPIVRESLSSEHPPLQRSAVWRLGPPLIRRNLQVLPLAEPGDAIHPHSAVFVARRGWPSEFPNLTPGTRKMKWWWWRRWRLVGCWGWGGSPCMHCRRTCLGRNPGPAIDPVRRRRISHTVGPRGGLHSTLPLPPAAAARAAAVSCSL